MKKNHVLSCLLSCLLLLQIGCSKKTESPELKHPERSYLVSKWRVSEGINKQNGFFDYYKNYDGVTDTLGNITLTEDISGHTLKGSYYFITSESKFVLSLKRDTGTQKLSGYIDLIPEYNIPAEEIATPSNAGKVPIFFFYKK